MYAAFYMISRAHTAGMNDDGIDITLIALYTQKGNNVKNQFMVWDY